MNTTTKLLLILGIAAAIGGGVYYFGYLGHDQACSGDHQCMKLKHLTCSKTQGKCVCDQTNPDACYKFDKTLNSCVPCNGNGPTCKDQCN